MADPRTVGELDEEYQDAVGRNDVDTLAKILADDFMLVVGNGMRYSRKDLLEEAESRKYTYDVQSDSQRTVRVWGDTAVVNALLLARGWEGETRFAYRVWFTDTYALIDGKWRYVFGQSGNRLPDDP